MYTRLANRSLSRQSQRKHQNQDKNHQQQNHIDHFEAYQVIHSMNHSPVHRGSYSYKICRSKINQKLFQFFQKTKKKNKKLSNVEIYIEF